MSCGCGNKSVQTPEQVQQTIGGSVSAGPTNPEDKTSQPKEQPRPLR